MVNEIVTNVFAIIDDDGFVVDEVAIFDEKEIANIPENYITPNYEKRLFVPKWDFDAQEWVEGLTPEEVAERESEIEKASNRPSDEEINAMAIMELTQLILGGGV